jgi:hypothetical protein
MRDFHGKRVLMGGGGTAGFYPPVGGRVERRNARM